MFRKTSAATAYIILALCCSYQLAGAEQVLPIALRSEYLANPEGIDTRFPRLSWQMQSSERGAKQSAYRVLVASSLELLNQNQGDL